MKNGKTEKKLMPTECLEKIEDFCVLVVDKNKKIIAYSKGCERIEEMKREDAIGKTQMKFMNQMIRIRPSP